MCIRDRLKYHGKKNRGAFLLNFGGTLYTMIYNEVHLVQLEHILICMSIVFVCMITCPLYLVSICLIYSCFICFFAEKTTKDDSANNCNNEFRFPPGCDDADCDYIATWVRNSADQVEFEIKNKVDDGQWTAIGFSEDQFMVSE